MYFDDLLKVMQIVGVVWFMQGLDEIQPLDQLTVGQLVTEMYYCCIVKLVVNNESS